MKPKIILAMSIVLLFLNCKLIRLTNAEKLEYKSSIASFKNENHQLLIPVNIDGKNEDFLFDTGASNTSVFDTLLISNYTKKEKLKIFSTTIGDGRKITYNHVPINIKNELYDFNNELVTVIPNLKSENNCSESRLKGIIGSSYFTKDTLKTVLLDFDESKIKIIKEHELKTLLTGDYKEIKSSFFGNHFNIFLKIGNIEEPYLFDTGNCASPILIGKKSKVKLINGLEYLGSDFITAGGTVKESATYFENIDITLGENNLKVPLIITDMLKSKYNNVGLDFIKRFNWVIDYKNQKVYLKKNNLKEEKISIFPEYKYLALIENNKIKITSKLKSELKYNIGDQIISIDNKKITLANICEMQNLLYKTKDWSSLQLEILPLKN